MKSEPKLYSLQHARLVHAVQILIDNDERLTRHLFSPKEPKFRADTATILSDARGYSSGEQLVIRAAIDLWNGTGATPLNRLLEVWDDQNWIRLIHAVTYLREIRGELLGALENESCV
jgi:hypothetical protein